MLEEIERKDGEDHEGEGVGDPWVDGVAHINDGIDRQAVNAGIHRQHDVGVQEHINDADNEGGHGQRDEGAFFGVHAAIDDGGSEDEDHAADEVGKIANTKSGRALKDELEHDLYKDNRAAGDRTEEKASE